MSRGRGSVVEERVGSLVEALDRAEEIMNNRETGLEWSGEVWLVESFKDIH